LEDILFDPLIVTRDIHFVSSVLVAGIVFFELFVAAPVLETDLPLPATSSAFREMIQKILWISLGISILSALAWLWLLSGRIADKPLDQVVADGTVWIVLSGTRFGQAWVARILVGSALAASSRRWWQVKAAPVNWRRILSALLAAAYLGSLAFGGHGEEGLGLGRNIHLASDFLHLLAVGLWLGGLIPLAMLLTFLYRSREEPWAIAACDAGSRFSSVGIFAVGILLVSGTINASFLVGTIENLIGTAYGQLLLLKIALFAAMFFLATINRQYLLPRLCSACETELTTQLLVRSALVEIVLGVGIILIVGILGIMPPAIDMSSHLH
jgi:putative copper resistance protein D